MINSIRYLKELQSQYGNINLTEVIEKLEKGNVVKSLKDITISCKRIYGKGCYELSGESRNFDDNLYEFLREELFDSEASYEEDKDDTTVSLPYNYIHELADCLLDGFIGLSHYVHYEDIKLSHELSEEFLMELLKEFKVDADRYEQLKHEKFEKRFEM